MNLDYFKKQELGSEKKGKRNIKIITQKNIFVCKQSIEEMIKILKISWVNKGVSDQYYPCRDSYEGEWSVEVLRSENKMKFDEVVDICMEDECSPATIFHVLSFLLTVSDYSIYQSMLAPASLYTDDFEHTGCVVVSIQGQQLTLGLGNWRGFKISGCDILRIKRIPSTV